MHLFNYSMCSNSKIDTTLIGHYMKSFFITVTKYFKIYEKIILDHLNYLKKNSKNDMTDAICSLKNNVLVRNSLGGENLFIMIYFSGPLLQLCQG